jgi:hypothetical protein
VLLRQLITATTASAPKVRFITRRLVLKFLSAHQQGKVKTEKPLVVRETTDDEAFDQ